MLAASVGPPGRGSPGPRDSREVLPLQEPQQTGCPRPGHCTKGGASRSVPNTPTQLRGVCCEHPPGAPWCTPLWGTEEPPRGVPGSLDEVPARAQGVSIPETPSSFGVSSVSAPKGAGKALQLEEWRAQERSAALPPPFPPWHGSMTMRTVTEQCMDDSRRATQNLPSGETKLSTFFPKDLPNEPECTGNECRRATQTMPSGRTKLSPFFPRPVQTHLRILEFGNCKDVPNWRIPQVRKQHSMPSAKHSPSGPSPGRC